MKRVGLVTLARAFGLATVISGSAQDLGLVEAKVRAIEKPRADFRLARIRTIAEGRAALTGD